jgi:hypothetical protein
VSAQEVHVRNACSANTNSDILPNSASPTLSNCQVLDWIRGMRDDGRAFFGDSSYRLAGVLLRKEDTLERDGFPTLERDGAGSEEGSSGDERGGSASDSSTASTGATEGSFRCAELLQWMDRSQDDRAAGCSHHVPCSEVTSCLASARDTLIACWMKLWCVLPLNRHHGPQPRAAAHFDGRMMRAAHPSQ